MNAQKLMGLLKEAIAESKRTDCEAVSAKAGADGSWQVELMDVMLKREPFAVSVDAVESASDQEIKEAIRCAIAEHYSMESY